MKYVVGDVEVNVIAERVQYLGPDGKLITESLKDFTRKQVKERYASRMTSYADGMKPTANRPSSKSCPNKALFGTT